MSAYRFCRSDDIPLLVEAHNRCYGVHFPGQPPLTIDGFKRAMRELDLWTSSCMVAYDNQQLVAVVLAAKRERANLIFRIGVHPDHHGRGHGRHLLRSLSQKLAILGPPRIVAELPADWHGARQFFEACGYACEARYTDFEAQPGRRVSSGQRRGLLAEVSVSDLVRAGALDLTRGGCWERSGEALERRTAEIRGVALASDVQIEGFVLYLDSAAAEQPAAAGPRDIMALGARESATAEPVLRLLLEHMLESSERPVRIRRAQPEEIAPSLLRELGFEPRAQTLGYAHCAAGG